MTSPGRISCCRVIGVTRGLLAHLGALEGRVAELEDSVCDVRQEAARRQWEAALLDSGPDLDADQATMDARDAAWARDAERFWD